MEPSIATMAAAVLWITRNEARIVEALASDAKLQGRVAIDDVAIDRLSDLTDAAILLGDLIQHEAMVEALLKVGALVDFPTFSSDTADIKPGSIVLLRAMVEDIHPNECRVRIEADGISHSFPARRRAIVGIEKPPIAR